MEEAKPRPESRRDHESWLVEFRRSCFGISFLLFSCDDLISHTDEEEETVSTPSEAKATGELHQYILLLV